MPYHSTPYANFRRRYRKTTRAILRAPVRAPFRAPRRPYAQRVNAKSIISRVPRPFGINLGDMLHVDRLANGRGAFPNELYCSLRYTDFLSSSADNLTGLTGSEVAYRLNSLFDPYFSGGGHQPLGFDQLTPIYGQYTVYKVDVQVRVTSYVGTGDPFLAVNVRPSTSTYVLSGLKNAGEILEQPNNTVLDGTIKQSWNQTFWIGSIEGLPNSKIMSENNYSAVSTTNPSNTPYLSLACGTYQTPASSTNSVYYQISFVFHARFSNQNPLAQS